MALRVACFAGARPNFMKIAPLLRALKQDRRFTATFVHTGQHYDYAMSDVFFRDLGMPQPDSLFEIGSGTHAEQTARTLAATASLIKRQPFDWAVVVGDVNSTVGVALAAHKLSVPVAHVEAGLRSDDRRMPEEINRIVTDHLSTLLFTPSADAGVNLEREGIDKRRVRLVGNIMIDSLVHLLPRAEQAKPWEEYELEPKKYAIMTAHRAENVDNRLKLRQLLDIVVEVSVRLPVIFPLHPRTKRRLIELEALDWLREQPGLKITEPLGYMEFLGLVSAAAVTLTDSGGLQEETTYLGVPCLTLRENTERPVTVEMGTNMLTGLDVEMVAGNLDLVLQGRYKAGSVPPLWDGGTAPRVIKALAG